PDIPSRAIAAASTPQRAHKKLVDYKTPDALGRSAQARAISGQGQIGGLSVATSPISDEFGALEQARSRLEAAVADDENWRALTQPGRDEDSAEARAARQARNTRLEMALAGNAHYQAWKHVNGAIDALRTRSVAGAQAAAPLVRPASADEATGGSDHLPENVAALLRDATPQGVQQIDEPVAP